MPPRALPRRWLRQRLHHVARGGFRQVNCPSMLANSSPESHIDPAIDNSDSEAVNPSRNGAAATSTRRETAGGAMPPAFDPHPVEAHWYPIWAASGDFKPRPPAPGEKPFVITIP